MQLWQVYDKIVTFFFLCRQVIKIEWLSTETLVDLIFSRSDVHRMQC